jgi:hypothetical protein
MDIVLRFVYSGSSDLRTFNVYQVFEGLSNELELYRVHISLLFDVWPQSNNSSYIQFHHPMTGLTNATTTFHRKNLSMCPENIYGSRLSPTAATLIFETAGQIEWSSNSNATVYFGIDEVIHWASYFSC